MTQTINETGWRGSPDVWLTAAYEALLESGIDAVKIQPLSKRLSLSRASFYWFYKDRDELLNALVSLWREKNTGNIVKRSEAYAETITEAIFNVSDCWFDSDLFDPKLEFAMRSWALQSDEILAEVHTADQVRLKALTDMFSRFGISGLAADVRARTIYLLQIGYISMQTNEDLKLRLSRMPEYVRVFTGNKPKRKELDRFFSRHGIELEEDFCDD
ncbi:TetR/AcrR family transcriptional regulator [Ochrobactrum chromiisoli]|uniref:Helix-turn-helix domain containing protein n=1 Tax=Ochrobactrum chromiisoli TaxID=2993941 RepID=A0ABT3QSI6_9HYPH|nr:helix-turn-helix domain-containing protein [Ochrobactrum chromiisoli]MCX2698566.1 helix-turn-helix domain containing protein [Ochrobactrum chromiisoli]